MNIARVRPWLPWLSLIITAVALAWAFHVLHRYSLADIARSLGEMKTDRLAMAGVFTLCSYVMLTLGDLLAVRTLGRDLAYRKIALTAFVSLSIGHTLGFAPFSSGAVRYRFYTRWGLGAEQVAKIMMFSAATITFGETGLAGLALAVDPAFASRILGIPTGFVRLLALVMLAAPISYVILAALRQERVRLFRWSLQLPSWRIAAMQVVVGIVNFGFVCAALHQTVLSVAQIDYAAICATYLLASLVAIVSHAPGGIGVIEVVIIKVLPNVDALGPVLCFRVIYFLIPFAVGVAVFLSTEIHRRIARPAADQRSATGPKKRTVSG
jgi:uncharacterized membrane protein YbhN (UPF0104 family)